MDKKIKGEIDEAIQKSMEHFLYKFSKRNRMRIDGDLKSVKVPEGDEWYTSHIVDHTETPDGNKSIRRTETIDAKLHLVQSKKFGATEKELMEWYNERNLDPETPPVQFINAFKKYGEDMDNDLVKDMLEWKSIIPDVPLSKGEHIKQGVFVVPCVRCGKEMVVWHLSESVICSNCGQKNILIKVKKVIGGEGGERIMDKKKPWIGKSIPVGKLATFMSQKGYTEDQIMEICIYVLGEFTGKVEAES